MPMPPFMKSRKVAKDLSRQERKNFLDSETITGTFYQQTSIFEKIVNQRECVSALTFDDGKTTTAR